MKILAFIKNLFDTLIYKKIFLFLLVFSRLFKSICHITITMGIWSRRRKWSPLRRRGTKRRATSS